jgi:hypothetical protein
MNNDSDDRQLQGSLCTLKCRNNLVLQSCVTSLRTSLKELSLFDSVRPEFDKWNKPIDKFLGRLYQISSITSSHQAIIK